MNRHGIGLRPQHFNEALAGELKVGLIEIISENFIGRGGRPMAALERVRRDAPVVLHGVSLSVGSLEAPSAHYLEGLAELSRQIEAEWVSDHLSFGSFAGHHAHDLWPLPFTDEALTHVCQRIDQVQDALGRRLVLENISSYVEYTDSTLSEWAFIREVLARTDCELLLDLNNLFINATNHGYDASQALRSIPSHRIRQLHLAGHQQLGSLLFDDHGSEVPEPVWALFRECVALHGPVPSIVEWDEHVPPLATVVAQSKRAAEIEADVLMHTRAAS